MTINTGLLFPQPQHAGIWAEDGEEGAGWTEIDGTTKLQFCFPGPDGGKRVEVEMDYEHGNIKIHSPDEPIKVAAIGTEDQARAMHLHNVHAVGIQPGATDVSADSDGGAGS